VHCPIAGPRADVCGSNCEGYCVILEEVCGARFSMNFESLVDCNQQCALLPDPVAFEATQNKGNTVAAGSALVGRFLDPAPTASTPPGHPVCP